MGDISNEPSMEEILSSIKKIIAEDSVGKVAPRRAVPAPSEPVEEVAVETPVVQPVADPVPSIEAAEDDVLELTQNAPDTAMETNPDLVSTVTAEASRSALASLSRMVVKPETHGSDTLEGLVRDMLRPMLKEWLDANLPSVVESVVAKEVARISGRTL
jgi:cell pole-organizing protein PopZ